ncbi:MAG: hypothetical protein SFY69_10520 [Planctomycetota bacterium]|nr:hypothetical protein [Planctomycetota bacterium]
MGERPDDGSGAIGGGAGAALHTDVERLFEFDAPAWLDRVRDAVRVRALGRLGPVVPVGPAAPTKV